VPTSRYETGGLRSANYQTAVWRWRTEQTIGTDGRNADRTAAEVDTRFRLGGELHYLIGPLAFSAEYLEVQYRGIELYHDLYSGSSRKVREQLHSSDGAVRSFSVWVSGYLTGESKRLTNFGWKTPKPLKPISAGGAGAWEILGRYSRTWTARNLFSIWNVEGYEDSPGTGNSVKLAVLDGAHLVHEFSLGVCWTLTPMLRIQLNDVFLWAPSADRDGDGVNDNWMLSGAKSDQSDPARKGIKTSYENAVMLRVIFKL
jgi:phosphate-selective porin